jgi:hypothetical protein
MTISELSADSLEDLHIQVCLLGCYNASLLVY